MSVGTSFEVSTQGGGEDGEPFTLQEAFLRFREKKMRQLQKQGDSSPHGESSPSQRSARDKLALRDKFLQAALAYMGVPYAKRYHPPESPTHDAPLFLDCCGLVRRVLRDLKEDFGFSIGPWNQAYMYDTLPISLSGPDDMKPGDLVFVSAIYYNPKSKIQPHNMVHVEIWLGEGDKTLGARWQKGVVEIHSSYQFVSKSYHSMEYHFKSIDTWLSGQCQSVCLDHKWQRKTFSPGKWSIFSLKNGSEQEASEEVEQDEFQQPAWQQESQAGSEEEGGCGREQPMATQSPQTPPAAPTSTEGGGTPVTPAVETIATDSGAKSMQSGPSTVDTVATNSGVKSVQSGPSSFATKKSIIGCHGNRKGAFVKPTTGASLLGNKSVIGQRKFIIQGGNAAPIVDSVLRSWGWDRIEDRRSLSYTLKWTELKQSIDYHTFREGDQLVNHFPNISLLTTKIGLLESLRSHQAKLHSLRLSLDAVVPKTYRLDVPVEREEFFQTYKDGEQWICKPTGLNQGKGIFLVAGLDQLREKLQRDQDHCRISTRPVARVVQRYLSQPLLLEGRKFDIRSYMALFAADKDRVLAFYRQGYVRLSCVLYDAHSADMTVHLTNQYVQKKHPTYEVVKDETVWDMDHLQRYLSEQEKLPEDWVANTLTRQMQRIMLGCYHSVRQKLEHRIGYFELLGFDFMLDADYHVWLIEVNINPAMHTNCDVLRRVVPPVVEETLAVAMEVWSKSRRGKPLHPLQSQRSFMSLSV